MSLNTEHFNACFTPTNRLVGAEGLEELMCLAEGFIWYLSSRSRRLGVSLHMVMTGDYQVRDLGRGETGRDRQTQAEEEEEEEEKEPGCEQT